MRYDGRDAACGHGVLARWLEQGRVVPFCPELAAGLPTPRPPAEIAAGQGGRKVLAGSARVLDATGADVTNAFLAGARNLAALAQDQGIRMAVLKEGSPSCGSGYTYDGSFGGRRVPLPGVATAALEAAGIRVFSEHQLDAAAEYLEGGPARSARIPLP